MGGARDHNVTKTSGVIKTNQSEKRNKCTSKGQILSDLNFKMEPVAKKQRFSSLTLEEIDTLVENKDSDNTKKATKNAITTLRAFCVETGSESPEELTKEGLDNFLLKF